MKDKILKNAIESIQVGVEDYKDGSSKRIVSSIRNIYAGILLLYKSKLNEFSPVDSKDAFIKSKIIPKFTKNGNIGWKVQGDKTVDVEQIVERFKDLDINIDDRTLRKIQEKRNQLEHHFLDNTSDDVLKGLINNSFILIRDFSENHLDKTVAELLGEGTYSILSEVSEFYKNEKEKCEKEIESLSSISKVFKEAILLFACDNCGSELITIKNKSDKSFICKSCLKVYEFVNIVPEVLGNYSDILTLANSGIDDDTIIDCPVCGEFSYIVEEGRCELCEKSVDQTCKLCEESIPIEELMNDGLCGYCRHKMEKFKRD